MSWNLARTVCLAVFTTALAYGPGISSPSSGTTDFVFDGNRVYARLSFVRPDGSLHKALAFVDMGSPSMTLDAPLYADLGPDESHPVRFEVGGLTVSVPAADVENGKQPPRPLGHDLVEGVLPAGVLKNFQVVIDYKARTLTLAEPGTLDPAGVAIPFQVNDKTGLISVDARIDGRPYAITIDNGSAWTWFRQSEVNGWLTQHPDWLRATGAVGPSNMMMIGDLESTGLLARIPVVDIGPFALGNVDILAPGATKAFPFELFDWYSRKNAQPVLGWLGGNVLKRYRLTIDYPNRMLYWQKQAEADTTELNRVGLVLRAEAGAYFVAGVASKDGHKSVAGVENGDRLVRIGSLDLKSATWGQIFEALHGKPGSRRMLVLDRGGHRIAISAAVTAF